MSWRLAVALALAMSPLCTLAVDEPAAVLPAGYRLDAQMRGTGYVLGDLLEQRIEVAVPPGAKLADDSVPRIGRVNNWMELRATQVEHRADTYSLRLTYQVFGAVDGATPLAVPGFRLRFADGARGATLPIAPQAFTLSPVLPSSLDEEDSQPRPSPAPLLLPERPALLGAAICLLASLLITFYLLWTHDRLPFLPRRPGPLALLFRRLRGRRPDLLHDGAYSELLRQVNQAFNRSAGETLYADNLALLFTRAPYLQPLHDDIRSLFLHSRDVFYGSAPPAHAWPARQIVALCRSARDCERGVR